MALYDALRVNELLKKLHLCRFGYIDITFMYVLSLVKLNLTGRRFRRENKIGT